MELFLLDTLKTTFRMEDSTQQWAQLGLFPPKIRVLFPIFKKGQGRLPPPSPSCTAACMIRPTLIDINLVELKHYPFMISLNKCTGSCNVLPPKVCVSIETKDINVKAFNMIMNKREAKAMT